jgi:hypothetical protein
MGNVVPDGPIESCSICSSLFSRNDLLNHKKTEKWARRFSLPRQENSSAGNELRSVQRVIQMFYFRCILHQLVSGALDGLRPASVLVIRVFRELSGNAQKADYTFPPAIAGAEITPG